MNLDFKNKTILLVHSGSVGKLFILEKIKELGVKIVCLNEEKKVFAENLVDHWVFSNLNNYKESGERIADFLNNHPDIKLDGVVTFWDECVFLTSYLAELFGLVGIPVAVAEKVKAKFYLREECEKLGLKTPRHKLLNSLSDIDSIGAELNFPVVVKPVYGAAKAFVTKVNSVQELYPVYKFIEENVGSFWLANEWKGTQLFAEEYIAGDEVDMDFLLQDGVIKYFSITDNDPTREPYFIETGQSTPSSLSAIKQKELIKMAEFTLKNLGVKNGCVHYEAKYGINGPVPIEINLRMGGGDVYIFSKSVWGIDLVENALRISFGIPLNIVKPEKPLECLAGKQFLSDVSGKVESIIIDDKLLTQKYVKQLKFDKKVGDIFLAPPQGYDSCFGWLLASGKTMEEAKVNLELGLKMVKINLNNNY